MALHVGITGGIGSGKSYVAGIFASYGVPVYYADDRAKWLMQNHPELKGSIIRLFGTEAYLDQSLNRAFLSQQIFNDSAKREALNQLVHPSVDEDFQMFAQQHQQYPYLLKEAALLLETGNHLELDRLIVVVCNLQERIQRVMKRDGSTEEQVRARIAAQWTDEQRLPYADFVLRNEGNQDIKSHIHQIHLQLTMEGQP